MKIATAIAITLIASSVHARALTEDEKSRCFTEADIAGSAILQRSEGKSASSFVDDNKVFEEYLGEEMFQRLVIEAFDPDRYQVTSSKYINEFEEIRDRYYIECMKRFMDES